MRHPGLSARIHELPLARQLKKCGDDYGRHEDATPRRRVRYGDIMLSLSIYANAALGTGPRRPSDSPPVAARVPVSKQPVTRSHFEIEILKILNMTPAHGESVQKAFDAKETCLRALFATLTADERATLYAMFTDDRDPLGFARLAAERRSRVITTLLGARCRV